MWVLLNHIFRWCCRQYYLVPWYMLLSWSLWPAPTKKNQFWCYFCLYVWLGSMWPCRIIKGGRWKDQPVHCLCWKESKPEKPGCSIWLNTMFSYLHVFLGFLFLHMVTEYRVSSSRSLTTRMRKKTIFLQSLTKYSITRFWSPCVYSFIPHYLVDNLLRYRGVSASLLGLFHHYLNLQVTPFPWTCVHSSSDSLFGWNTDVLRSALSSGHSYSLN